MEVGALVHALSADMYIQRVYVRTRDLVTYSCHTHSRLWLPGQEGIECWYSDHTRTGRCRENFDFADHTVLFLSHYLAITTFEVLAVLTEVRPHFLANISTRAGCGSSEQRRLHVFVTWLTFLCGRSLWLTMCSKVPCCTCAAAWCPRRASWWRR